MIAKCPLCEADRVVRFDSTFHPHTTDRGVDCPASGETLRYCYENYRLLYMRLWGRNRQRDRELLREENAHFEGRRRRVNGMPGFVWRGRWRQWTGEELS